MKVKIAILFLLFVGITVFIFWNKNKSSFRNTNLLSYENYLKEDVILPKEIDSANVENCFTDFISIDNEFILQENQKLSKSVSDILLDQNVINNWSSFKDFNPYGTYELFLKECRKNIVLYNGGKLKLSEKFDSYLILSETGSNKELYMFRNLYLINTVDRQIKSISRIASFEFVDGDYIFIFSKIQKNHIILLKKKTIFYHLIMPDGTSPEKDDGYVKFVLNPDGYIEIL